MKEFFIAIVCILMVNALVCFYRVVVGTSILDRMVAINIIGTKTLIVLALMSYIFDEGIYLNLAFVYGLFNFVVTIAVARYLEAGGEEECLE
ncbi:MAG: pH regulation protein F [Candidatus Schekmanbacteria bacterium]|nr:pH regulation protein F [Candidatus Schekmanbacteria bacterium]